MGARVALCDLSPELLAQAKLRMGALCLIDFTQRFDRASTLAERVYKAWFGLDGVYFNRDQVDYVAARTAPEYYAEARSRVPYTPWYPTRYLFAGRKEA